LLAPPPALAQAQRSSLGRFLAPVFDDDATYAPSSLDVGEDGHIVVAATVPGDLDTVSAALVARFDGTGRKLWERSPAAAVDLVSAMIARTAPGGDTMVLHDEAPNDQPQLVLLRLATSGKELWRRPLGPGAASDLLVERDGTALVSGSVRRDKDKGFDALVMRITPGGKVAWRRQIPGDKRDGGNTADLLRAAVHGQPGGPYVVGGLADIAYADNNTVQSSRGLLARLGGDGTIQWQRHFGGDDGLTMVSGLVGTASGDTYALSLTESAGGGQFLQLSRVRPDGQLAWTRPLSGPPDQEVNDIARAPAGGLVLAGSEADGDSRTAVLVLLDGEGIERARINYRGYRMRRALMVRPYPTGGYAVLFEGAGPSRDGTLYLARVDASGRF
jgi:hypothetical protein